MSVFRLVDELQPPPDPVLHMWHGSTDVSTNVWPPNLPPPELLHHLAETVFSSVPLATRVIHRPIFMASLALPPSSPRFPHASILHAICALASLYTPIVTDIDNVNSDSGMSGVVVNAGVFQRRSHGAGIFRNSDKDTRKAFNFATIHSHWSREASFKSLHRGEAIVEQVQSMILLAWFHHSRGDFVATVVLVGALTKLIAILGFNASSSCSPLSRIPSGYLYAGCPPLTAVEEETFRNIFWVAYVMERLVNATNVWVLSFEDMDCSQTLPCRLRDFTKDVAVPKQARQHLLSRNVLVTHLPLSTDSFTLYVKAAVIFGQVRTFNCRYKQHYDAPDVQSISTPASKAKVRDPRETAEFKALDDVVDAFIASIPREFKDPVGLNTGAKLDPTLYVAHLLPHMATITLHDPHANVFSADDPSAQKILSAARGIMGLIYNVCSTTFDPLFLDHMSSTAWFLAGTTIIRFLAAKTAQGDEVEVGILKEELSAVKFMLTNLGDRTGIGLRQLKLLNVVYELEIEAQARPQN
ncbi:hypothetical protein FRB97_007677 [Tulasnella sp. 331]|nr:hypothetical protein FRB97_007677 [Tulasnella sp. 331]